MADELERLIKLKAQANPSPERQPGDGVLLASHLNTSEFYTAHSPWKTRDPDNSPYFFLSAAGSFLPSIVR
jgi:hypothetical protein